MCERSQYIHFVCLSGRYSTEHIVSFVKEKLKSMPCQNQGFVLDGFPKTYEEAQLLFARKLMLSPLCKCVTILDIS